MVELANVLVLEQLQGRNFVGHSVELVALQHRALVDNLDGHLIKKGEKVTQKKAERGKLSV